MATKMDKEEMEKLEQEAREYYQSGQLWEDSEKEAAEAMNPEKEAEWYRERNMNPLRLHPMDEDEVEELAEPYGKVLPTGDMHEKTKEPAPDVATWVFRPGGKDKDNKILGWWIGKKGSERFFASSDSKGLERIHFLLERRTRTDRPIRVEKMEEPAKNRSSIIRSGERVFSQLTAAAAGHPDFEEVLAHLKEHVHFGTMCSYDPGQDEINWILK